MAGTTVSIVRKCVLGAVEADCERQTLGLDPQQPCIAQLEGQRAARLDPGFRGDQISDAVGLVVRDAAFTRSSP